MTKEGAQEILKVERIRRTGIAFSRSGKTGQTCGRLYNIFAGKIYDPVSRGAANIPCLVE